MSVDTKHPLYSEFYDDWVQMTDCYDGERFVKAKGTTYLPATSGMILDGLAQGSPGYDSYRAYKLRAVFPEYVRDSIEGALGILHSQPPTIVLPKKLEPMLKNATVHGESLFTLLRKINQAQLLHGRFGLLLEAPNGQGPNAVPFIASYTARNIINWDSGSREEGKQILQLVVLDETEQVRDNFQWVEKQKWRVLALSNIFQPNALAGGTYMVATFNERSDALVESSFAIPEIGGKKLEQIPFVFINTNDLVADPDNPPLLGLANTALTVYRGEADYRQSLFMQGQDTLVTIGITDEEFKPRIGANAHLSLPIGGDAKFIGVDSNGLSEQREALMNDEKRAAEKGARLMDFGDTSRQSGEALRIRSASKSATLTTIALAGAEGLATILRQAAEWVGANPEEVQVKPNLEFSDEQLDGMAMFNWSKAKSMGAPISNKSLHRMLKKQNITQMEFEEEIDQIEEEQMAVGGDISGTGVEDGGSGTDE